MEFFKHFSTYNELYNVYKEIEFENLDLEGCTMYNVMADDNLMNISYRSYNTVDNWWIIYFFNKMHNILDFPNDDMIFSKIDDVESDLYIYSTLTDSEKNNVYNFVLDYKKATMNTNDISEIVEAVNIMIESPDFEDVVQFKDYLYDMYIYENNHYKYLKIPSIENVRKMKQQMNKYNTLWSELNG